MLGWFHLVLAVPVLAGAASSRLPIDRALCVASAMVFTAVGGFFLLLVRRLHRSGPGSQS